MVRAILELAWKAEEVVMTRPMILIPVAGLVVAALAIAFAQVTGQPAESVLFSGQDAMGQVVQLGPTLSAGTLIALLIFKGLAWSVSLASFRGGPTFPAIFVGLVGGVLAANVLGLSETAMIAIGMGATTVAMLRLPLSSVILAMVVTQAGLSLAPLIIVAMSSGWPIRRWSITGLSAASALLRRISPRLFGLATLQ
jgi:H+/Cl- antiporter ClcA